MIALTDAQLGLLFAAAAVVPYAERERFLIAFAAAIEKGTRKSTSPTDDAIRAAIVSALTDGGDSMMVADIIHRLRNRAVTAQNEGKVALAQDLRLAIDALTRLDREAAVARLLPAPRPEAIAK